MELITYTCPSCGANLKLENHSQIFDKTLTCRYCKNSFQVEVKYGEIGANVEARLILSQEEFKQKLIKDKINFKYLMYGFFTFVLCCIIVFFSIFISNIGTVTIEQNSKELRGENYENIKSQLEDMGFTNIHLEVLEDLKLGLLKKDGEVEKVTIDGESDYDEGDRFKPESKVRIIYHTFKE